MKKEKYIKPVLSVMEREPLLSSPTRLSRRRQKRITAMKM